jgi:hypothetical protein
MFYLREIESVRPDVIAVDLRLLRRSWYYDYLARAYPEWMAENRDSVSLFVEDLRSWEQDPRSVDQSPGRLQRINSRFFGMLTAMIRRSLERRAVHVTNDVAFLAQDENAELTRIILATWALVPRGLTFQLRNEPGFVPPGPPPPIRLTRARRRFASDDVVQVKVVPAYATMLVMRGRYLAGYGHHRAAIEAYDRAAALMPGLPPALEGRAASLEALGTQRGAERGATSR